MSVDQAGLEPIIPGAAAQSLEGDPALRIELQLAAATSASAEVTATQRPELHKLVRLAVASCVSTQEQRAMILTGKFVDWQLFGRRGDPLPEGQIWLHDNVDGACPSRDDRIAPDVRSGHSAHDEYTASRRLYQLGVTDIRNAVIIDTEGRRPEREQLLTELIHQLPEYRLLESFALPSPGQEQRPLSPQTRMMHEQMIERDVRRHHSIPDHHTIPQFTPAGKRLRRSSLWLDQQTETRSSEDGGESSALSRAREYFRDRVIESLTHGFPQLHGAVYGNFTTDKYNGLYLSYTQEGQEKKVGVDRTLFYLAKDIANELGLGDFRFQTQVGETLLQNIVPAILDPSTHGDYASLLANGVRQTTQAILARLGSSTGAGNSLTFTLLRMPTLTGFLDDATYRTHAARNRKWQDQVDSDPGFVRQDRLASAQNTVYGQIEYGSLADLVPRLIQHAPYQTDVAQYTTDHDALLYLSTSLFGEAADPYIPGYTLSFRRGDTYGFKRADTDPYSRCEVDVQQSQLQILTEQYAQLGMHTLAQTLQGHNRLSVAELVDLIKSQTTYTVPIQNGEDLHTSDDLPITFSVNSLQDFEPMILDGRLLAQCTGSARFLELSLATIFGASSTSTTQGLYINWDGYVTAVAHAQTSFVHNGRLHILDSTGVQPGGANFGTNRPSDTSERPAPAVATPDAVPMPKFDTTTTLEPIPQIDRATRLATMKQTFEAQMSVLYGVSSQQELYEHVLRLHADDPIRRTVSAFARASNEAIPVQDLESLVDFVERYKDAPAEAVKQARLPYYDARVLESILVPLRQLAYHYCQPVAV